VGSVRTPADLEGSAIDLVDAGMSGANDEYGISLDNGYMSGLQPLGGGNVVVH